ncbi:unnamed protein product [Cercopithifilaria johnstoni]|uniref:Uncharacterized protein n=1 Tax=Cercopithifilaria johnstoni TaxID=2874296 RepID=A0A8J2Q2T5_9BILA|nr:unnamed protein product [Cercopithifilaria johnstoni]
MNSFIIVHIFSISYWSYPLDEDMLQLLIIGYVIYEIIRLSNLPDAGSYVPPQQPQSSLPLAIIGKGFGGQRARVRVRQWWGINL